MLISDLSYLATAETSIVGGGFYIPPFNIKNNKVNVILQDADASAFGASYKGDVYVKASASNYASAYNG